METPSTFNYPDYAIKHEYQEPVGAGRRFANYVVDVAGMFIFGMVVALICLLLGLESFVDSWEGPLMSRLISIVLAFVYYLVLESLFGRTLGKLVTGTKVVLEDGSKPPFGTIFKRTLWRCVPFDALTFLGHGQGWHDTKSDTLVVRNRRS